MKREILKYLRHVSGCCPGHDQYPGDTYRSNRSKRARARGKKAEHQHARTLAKQALTRDLKAHLQTPE